MAKFETSGFDEILDEFNDLAINVPGAECPECGGEIVIPLNADSVTCTHCGTVITIMHRS